MNTAAFLKTRPYAYHLTATANLPYVQRNERLAPASYLLRKLDQGNWTRRRRPEHLKVKSVVIRDQAPLHEGAIDFQDGWSLPDLVEYLNEHVFFWPGDARGPVQSGRNHFARYKTERTAILRFRSEDLIDANPKLEPRVCEFNSGAPRVSGGKYSPRGPNTFKRFSDFDRRPSDVVELVFRGVVTLPTTEVSYDRGRSWNEWE